MRIIFKEITDGCILRGENPDGEEVSIRLLPFQMYICGLLSPGDSVNAVECTLGADGITECELLIYNPDYLVDITTVAGCFESYGASPLISLVKKIQPDVRSHAIMLGNFAGEMLDRIVHENPESPLAYNDMARDFFQKSALSIAATENFESHSFHNEARNQLANIRKAVHRLLPEHVPGTAAAEMILEPTFFCEPLGLQGRMDLISSDFRLVVEQKAGKGEFGSDRNHPAARYPHQIQLLLYRAIFRYGFDIPSGQLSGMLLYSRYPEPLVIPRSMVEPLRQAIEMRNRIVALEQELACGDEGYSILDSLTPEFINPTGGGGVLWSRYTEPSLRQLLNLYHNASETERLYVRRMMEFTAREHLESKTGFNEELIKGGFSTAWTMPVSQRLEQGELYIGLTVESLTKDESGKVVQLSLILPDDGMTDAANFRTGDIVALYSYDADCQPDIRRSIVIRATLGSFSQNGLSLTLRSPQPELLFSQPDRLWAVEPDFYESSFRQVYRNIFSLLDAPADRRRVFFHPGSEGGGNHVLKGEYGELNTAVANALGSNGIFAMIGPPGAGKTSFGLMSVLREELRGEGNSVLLTAYTNRAVDEICSRLINEGIDFIRLGSSANCPPAYSGYLLDNCLAECRTLGSYKDKIRKTRVFVGTTHSVTGSPLLRLRRFSLAIVDEASQILEPQIAGLMAATYQRQLPSIGRFVLIGDHKQLPAVVRQDERLSEVSDPELNAIGLYNCRDSFFERFLRVNRREDGSYNPEKVFLFTRQGRMHPDVARFAVEKFYNGNLTPVPLPHQLQPISRMPVHDEAIGNLLNRQRSIFIDVDPGGGNPGNVNAAEAEMVARVAEEIWRREGECFDPETTLGIIVPYRMQGAKVRNLLRERNLKGLEDVTVDTVERFQGGQRKYIIYTTVATRPQQMFFLTSSRFTDFNGAIIDRKLNVALTRAKEFNIIIGNAATLSTDPLYREMIADFRQLTE